MTSQLLPLNAPLTNRLRQRGALFGMDARLALGVFAILSLVAGYVAFWRIQAARDARLYKVLTDTAFALQQYQNDLGTFFIFTLNKSLDSTSNTNDLDALWNKDLLKPGFQANWHGPYLLNQSHHLAGYGTMSLLYATGDRKNTCTTDSDCYVWLVVENVPAQQWAEINQTVDGGGVRPKGEESFEQDADAIAMGKVQADSAADPRTLFFRTVARAQ